VRTFQDSRQAFCYGSDGLVRDPGQPGAEAVFGVKTVQFCISNQTVHRGDKFLTAVGTRKQVAPSTKWHGERRSLGPAIIESPADRVRCSVCGTRSTRARIDSHTRSRSSRTANAVPSPYKAQFFEQKSGSRLSDTQPEIGRLSAYLVFDSVKGTSTRLSLDRCTRCVDNMDLVKLGHECALQTISQFEPLPYR
jgi:hypothetical protein